MKNICVISSNYPDEKHPARGVFVQNLVRGWEDMGVCVEVVAPKKLHSNGRGSSEIVHRPAYLSLSNFGRGFLSTGRVSDSLFTEACLRATGRLISIPDVLYAHFLFPSASGANAVRRKRFPSARLAVAVGESDISAYERRYSLRELRLLASSVDRFVAVSDHLGEYLVRILGVRPEHVLLSPNAAANDVFFPRDKHACRSFLGLSDGRFIVVYVGHMNERKGAQRLCDALAEVPGVDILLVGAGCVERLPANATLVGVIGQSQLASYLCAADVFVLPTLGEGRCNAVEEALACGLPVVMGDVAGARSQVEGRGGVVVPPRDIQAIRNAVVGYSNNRESLNALRAEAIGHLSSQKARSRAKEIYEWITM